MLEEPEDAETHQAAGSGSQLRPSNDPSCAQLSAQQHAGVLVAEAELPRRFTIEDLPDAVGTPDGPIACTAAAADDKLVDVEPASQLAQMPAANYAAAASNELPDDQLSNGPEDARAAARPNPSEFKPPRIPFWPPDARPAAPIPTGDGPARAGHEPALHDAARLAFVSWHALLAEHAGFAASACSVADDPASESRQLEGQHLHRWRLEPSSPE